MTRSFRVPLECEAMGLDMTAYGAEASQINTFGSTPMAMINYSMHGMTVMDNRHHGGAARGGGGKGAGGGSPTPSRWAATATAGGNGGGGGAGTTAF